MLITQHHLKDQGGHGQDLGALVELRSEFACVDSQDSLPPPQSCLGGWEEGREGGGKRGWAGWMEGRFRAAPSLAIVVVATMRLARRMPLWPGAGVGFAGISEKLRATHVVELGEDGVVLLRTLLAWAPAGRWSAVVHLRSRFMEQVAVCVCV